MWFKCITLKDLSDMKIKHSVWIKAQISPWDAVRCQGPCSYVALPFSSSVQFSSVAQLCPTLCNLVNCSTPGLPVHHHSRSSLKLWSINLVMPFSHLILYRPHLLLPSIFPSIRVFSNESGLHIRWPQYWGFSFRISPSNEHPGLISFRMDWLHLLTVQGTLKESSPTPQFKSVNSSALSFL